MWKSGRRFSKSRVNIELRADCTDFGQPLVLDEDFAESKYVNLSDRKKLVGKNLSKKAGEKTSQYQCGGGSSLIAIVWSSLSTSYHLPKVCQPLAIT